MTTAVAADDYALTVAVGRHLDAQLESARRLLDLVLRQGAAVRERNVELVLARLADIKSEMAAREMLERERERLLERAGQRLGVAPSEVTLSALTELMDPPQAEAITARSAELRGLLAEIAREHGINRALMRQELAFVDHLVRLVGEQPQDGPNRLMDVEA